MNNHKFVGLYKRLLNDKFLIFSDQALYAFFNFGSIFVLSKFAPVNVFGAYVIFLSYINFVFIFSTFFFSSPILVLLPKKWRQTQGVYIVSVLSSNVILCLLLSGICYFFIKASGESISPVFIFLVPFLMSTFDIFKKYLFASYRLHFIHNVIASIILNAAFFIGIFWFQKELSFYNILYALVFAFIISNSYLFGVLLYFKIFVTKVEQLNISRKKAYKSIIKQHYTYSKWIIVGGVAFWGYSQGLFIMSKQLGVDDFGISKVRTIQNILGVVNIFIVSIENYYIPYFANYVSKNPDKGLKDLVSNLYKNNYLKVLIGMIGVFLFALGFYTLLYENKYGSDLFIILVFTIIQLLLFFIRPLCIALKAIEITYPFFLAHIAALITMIVLGGYIIPIYGYKAMPVTFLISNLVFSLLVGYFYLKKVNKV